MTDGEFGTRHASQYLSSYKRVSDYYDAVKIGIHQFTKYFTGVFGKLVYTYSYREAVADDWLIEHEPPICYETLLTQKGIHFERGEVVSAINTETGEVETEALEDELNFDVENFNR